MNKKLKYFEEALLSSDSQGIKAKFDLLEKDVLEIFENKRKVLNKLSKDCEEIEIQTRESEKTTITLEQALNKPKICIHCSSEFTMGNNREDSCVYHPGKIKYYSCRNCGSDEYHDCCWKCSKCSEGCRRGRHVFEI